MTRYILAELAKLFVYSLGGLTGLMLIVGAVQEAVKQGLPVEQIIRLIPYILPEALRVAVPVAVLLATTSVYSRMAGSNEVLAIKALGISPIAIIWPVLAAAFLLSLATVWLNDVAVSWGRLGAQRVVLEGIEQIAYGMLRTERCYSSPRLSINVKRVEDRRLIGPIVLIPARGDTPAITIEAQEAELQADAADNVLKVVLRNGEFERDRVRVRFPDVLEKEIPLSEASRVGQRSQNPSCLPLWRIPAEIARQQQTIQEHKERSAAQAAFQMLTGQIDSLIGPDWDRRAQEAAAMRTHLCRLKTEPYRRWSAGFSCLFFAWVGAPMAIWLRNKDFLTSFFLCFCPILVIYYPLLAYGIDGAKNGTIPPVFVWSGNVVLFVAGAWLFRKVFRY